MRSHHVRECVGGYKGVGNSVKCLSPTRKSGTSHRPLRGRGFRAAIRSRSCRVRRERRRQVLCRHYPLPTWKVWQTGRCPNWGLWQRSRQMDPPCCAEGMGTHQGLEQGGRARSKGGKGRRGPRTLQDAGRSHTGVPEHQDAAEGTPSPTIAGNWRTRSQRSSLRRPRYANKD